MLNKPQDIVIMFAIIAAVVVTVNFGILSIQEQGADTGGTTFFSDVQGDITSSTGIKNTADEASDVIDPSDQLVADASEESIITQGLQSLRSIGATYKSVETVMKEGTKILGIDAIYWQLLSFTFVIIIFVLIYTWARGN